MRTNLFASLTIALILSGALRAQELLNHVPAQQPPASQTPSPRPDETRQQPTGTAGTPTAPTEGYVIGPQDNLSIIVSDEAELTGKYRVDTDGTISMPYLNRVPVAGLSLAEAQAKITSMLQAGYIRNPQVRIEVDQFKSRSVLVTGEVRTPGKVTLPGSTMSLLEALALAGSPTTNASNEVIVIHSPKPGEPAPEPITINRRDLELGRAGRDLTLQDGDIVNVPIAKRFYISGFVKNPGSYVLETGTTVSQAIILAGGLTERGTDRRVRVNRVVNGRTVDLPIELDEKVQPNDEIKIRARFF